MDIGKKEAIAILSQNLGYPIVETALGTAIKMNAKEAFLYANVTGSGYFDNPTYLFSPKGTQKILREAFQYNFVTGIFDGANLFYSPAELDIRKPYIFHGPKYIVFEEFKNECAFTEKLHDSFDMLTDQGIKTTDFIISRIETIKIGNGMEPFLEYLACEHFKKQGFVVENQIPLKATVGSPDFGGYKVSNSNGFHINELSLLRIFKNYEITESLDCTSVIVGEAKTATTVMEKQLKKYLNTGLFSKGYELHPNKPVPSNEGFGLLNIDEEHIVNVSEPLTTYEIQDNNSLSIGDYKQWIGNYFKYFLVANLTKKEFADWIKSECGTKELNVSDIVSLINGLSINQILEKIKEN